MFVKIIYVQLKLRFNGSFQIKINALEMVIGWHIVQKLSNISFQSKVTLKKKTQVQNPSDIVLLTK